MHGRASAMSAPCNSLAGQGALGSVEDVVTAASIGSDKAAGYARYLDGKTERPGRGDYYLSPDGELAQAPGHWHSEPGTLARLGVDAGAPVAGDDFRALMEGRHPGTGRWVRPEGAGGGRGGGIDVTFSAPKSVSVVWALSDQEGREAIEAAHTQAVAETVTYMRERVPLVRRRRDNQVIEQCARDVVAAEYRHTTARGVTGAAAPDPQLHSHLVITAVIRDDERVVAVSSRPVFRAAGELGAYYRSALAQRLDQAGYAIEAGTGKDGRYFEIKGVPERVREAFSGRSREVARAAERFRARYGRPPERGELKDLAQKTRSAKTPTTRPQLETAWRQTAREHGFDPQQANTLRRPQQEREQHRQDRERADLQDKRARALDGRGRDRLLGPVDRPLAQHHDLEQMIDRIEQRLTDRSAIFAQRDLHSTVLEQTVGALTPGEALQLARLITEQRRVIPLQGDRLTTLSTRAREQAIERRAQTLAAPAARDAGLPARQAAMREVSERIGAPLTPDQTTALQQLTGPTRLGVLVGPAGTGKGVVIDAAVRAEQRAGRQVIGIAVSGSTAQRLGRDSPALQGQTMTLDSLATRASAGRIRLDQDTTVVLDEAGMTDHRRLDKLTSLVVRTGAKLIAVGDGRQLPAIGPGGMFDRLAHHATDTAELQAIHRTQDPAEQQAWRDLRAGRPDEAMAHYLRRGQLHLADTREDACEAAVQHWHKLTQQHGPRQVALIADASNQEIDRLNARAQHLRRQHGQIGDVEVELASVHYGLREQDLITFVAQHHPRGQRRIENGTRGQITRVHNDGTITVQLDGTKRHIQLQGDAIEKLRLAYAQHVYRQQGATVDRTIAITGGWQTSQQSAYVQASRARNGTDWYIGRDQLPDDGHQLDQLTRRMSNSRQPEPSINYPERTSVHAPDLDRAPALDHGWYPQPDPLGQARHPLHRLLLHHARERQRHDRANRARSVGR